MKIDIVPVPKPRMTRADAWKKRPAVLRYWTFCDELRLKHKKKVPDSLALIFYLPMPKSWSAKKKLSMEGKPHQGKPDIDNLQKSFLDALCEDDSYVYRIRAEKYWANRGSIVVSNYE